MGWKIDSAHSSIHFKVRHMMITNVHGEFKGIEGIIDFDEVNPTASTVDVTIDANSIDTNEPKRDAHLRSADFLDAENYPTLTFKSLGVKSIDPDRANVAGELTIRGVTRPVTLEVEYTGQGTSPRGHTMAGFSGLTRINRKDWGLTWNMALETGGVLVGDEISISIELELIKEAEVKAALA